MIIYCIEAPRGKSIIETTGAIATATATARVGDNTRMGSVGVGVAISTRNAIAAVVRRSQVLRRRSSRRGKPSKIALAVLPSPELRRLRASSVSINGIETTAEAIPVDGEGQSTVDLGCPICYQALTPPLPNHSLGRVECSRCNKAYHAHEYDSHLDLTITSDYVESVPLVTQFFSTPVMSFLYERGWRQNFGLGGYPGPDREFEMARRYLKPVLGGNLVDASCGSGLFSRRFAKSGLFSLVFALDYSAAMLRQCYEFVKEDPDFPTEKLILVRADISRLPFVSGSVDAVHAGAALHCWPSPVTAVAEISRVLRPGGVFVATTTLADGPFTLLPFRRIFRENLQQLAGSRIFLSERELEVLCMACGLGGFSCERNGPFIMISATKHC